MRCLLPKYGTGLLTGAVTGSPRGCGFLLAGQVCGRPPNRAPHQPGCPGGAGRVRGRPRRGCCAPGSPRSRGGPAHEVQEDRGVAVVGLARLRHGAPAHEVPAGPQATEDAQRVRLLGPGDPRAVRLGGVAARLERGGESADTATVVAEADGPAAVVADETVRVAVVAAPSDVGGSHGRAPAASALALDPLRLRHAPRSPPSVPCSSRTEIRRSERRDRPRARRPHAWPELR